MRQSHRPLCINALCLIFVGLWVNVSMAGDAAFETDLVSRASSVFGSLGTDIVPDRPVKCATPLAYEIRMTWPALSAGTRQQLSEIINLQERPVLDEFYDHDTPEGSFRIHYSRTGTHAVDMSFGVGEGNVPVYVLRCAAFLDTTVKKEVTELGYRFPVSDQLGNPQENPRYDIYFQNLGAGFYGLTVSEAVIRPDPSAPFVSTSYLQLNNDYKRLFGYANRPFDAMAVTVAHELHHAVQWSYDAFEAEIRIPPGGTQERLFPWFFEITSTYLEDVVFDHVNDYFLYLPAFFDNPWLSLRRFAGGTGPEALHAYAASVWGHFLRERYDDFVMVEIWEECGRVSGFNTFSAMEKALTARGTSFADEWAEFLVWNYFTGDRASSWSYSEGGDFDFLSGFGGKIPDSLIATFSTYPLDTVSFPVIRGLRVRAPHHSDELGATYLRFIPGISQEVPNLNLLITPNAFNEWMVVTAGLRSGFAPDVSYTRNVFDPIVVPDWSRFDEVLVVVSPFKANPTQDQLDVDLGFAISVQDSFDSGGGRSAIAKVYSNPLLVTSAGAEDPFQVDVTLAAPADVSMHIFTADGGLVAGGREDDMFASAGPRNVKLRWSGTNRSGKTVAAGVYIAMVRIGDKQEILKVAVKNSQ